MKILSFLAISFVSLSVSFAQANTSTVLVNCSAEILTSTDARFGQTGARVPLIITDTQVSADSSSTGQAFENISVEFENQYSFIASGDLNGKAGHSATLTPAMITVNTIITFDANGPDRKLSYAFNRETNSLKFVYRHLPFGSPVVITAQCR